MSMRRLSIGMCALLAAVAGLWACRAAAGGQVATSPTGSPSVAAAVATQVAPATPGLTEGLNVPTQNAVTPVQTLRGDVQPGAQSIFGITGESGQAVRIEVQARSGAPDLTLELSTPGGEVLTRVDGAGAGGSEAIGEFRFPTTGYYELAVGTLGEAGQIDVLVYPLSDELLSGGGIIPGFDQPVSGTMDRPATIHSFTLQVERGQRFDLWATALSGDLDLLFELYDPQGVSVATRDDSLGYDPYLFNYMPAAGGTYTVVLTNYEQTTGGYQIVARRSQSSGQLAFGRRQTIALPTEPHHGLWLDFVANAGEGLTVEAQPISPEVDLTLAVYDVYGNRLGFTNLGGPGVAEQLKVQVPFDGPYQLEFGTLREGGQVRYDIIHRNPADFDTNGPLLAFPTTRKLNLATGSIGVTYAYWFDGEEGQPVTFDATTDAGTMDLAFDLYDPAGNLLSSHDDDRGRDPVMENYRLPFSGRYYLILKVGGDHRGGEFRLQADMPPPPDQPGTG